MGRGRGRRQKVRQENVESGHIARGSEFKIRNLDLIHYALLPLLAVYLPIPHADAVFIRIVVSERQYAIFIYIYQPDELTSEIHLEISFPLWRFGLGLDFYSASVLISS